MKFGETLYQRSVPKWATYNVKYNELKHLIKQRTSAGSSAPISIPTAGTSRWQDLENELHSILNKEYQDVALFLRTKQGEVDRRLAYLDKQVSSSLKAVGTAAAARPVTQARKYQKLVKDAEAIGDEIESLSRFAAVQKTAFRKILKKYRKWTGSTALQERLERDVFSSGALQVDYAVYLQSLSKLTNAISSQLQVPMLTGNESPYRRKNNERNLSQSNAQVLNELCAKGALHFDAALDEVLYGASGGSAHFWIHPEYLEQVEALLLRHMRQQDQRPSSRASPSSSTDDLAGGLSSVADETHQVVFDNLQRFLLDESVARPSRAAVIARWNGDSDAVVTLSNLACKSDASLTLALKRKHMQSVLDRSSTTDGISSIRRDEAQKIKDYLLEHRDVKPLAAIHSGRSRFLGLNNTKDVGTWATLDNAIRFAPVLETQLGASNTQLEATEAFPHAVLHVRWEFTRLPEIVRLLETSHLAERVHDFSLERATIFTINKELQQPAWRGLLASDIRKVPALVARKGSLRPKGKETKPVVVVNSSGPSSAGGDSVFSATQGQSSATELDIGEETSTGFEVPVVGRKLNSELPEKLKLKSSRKQRASVLPPPATETAPDRYWNEFDDGDSDVNVEERYAIYVDPNEESFPGAETFSKAFGSMYDSLRKGKDRVVSWWPMASADRSEISERSPLLFGASRQGSNDAAMESSGSETEDYMRSKSRRQRRGDTFRSRRGGDRPLSKRQRALERTLFQFYTGLIVLAYLLLVMASILLGTGKKKRRLEVDAGVVTGVVAAEACVGVSIVLISMRRQKLGPVHWGLMAVNATVITVVGIAELVLMFGNTG
ncbi:uncharacterized protein HMPREF1541_09220 [Cyphellophora europaea CBS 101466]|uniref:SPX domain-containing protein n=1 Tax=Cyphellophora europaea (strain CBS 101466) TaxID=1220924 RepID=W2SBV6_CYPE1|nr:uncharacterized protein HMPREF1541_09220 [Cyphellophora europaea CBS 101466]ETN45389.1 hypothetical protein HMPREF1541_09220 [Cyphellophora europaea CBS 101466]